LAKGGQRHHNGFRLFRLSIIQRQQRHIDPILIRRDHGRAGQSDVNEVGRRRAAHRVVDADGMMGIATLPADAKDAGIGDDTFMGVGIEGHDADLRRGRQPAFEQFQAGLKRATPQPVH